MAALSHDQAAALDVVSAEMLPAYVACDDEFKRYVGVTKIAPDADRPHNLSGVVFLPSAEEWASGARWIRCDAVLRAIDTQPERSTTESLRNALSKDPLPASMRECYRDLTGPTDSGNEGFVSCDQPHRAESLVRFHINDPKVGPLLGDQKALVDYVLPTYKDQCADRVAARVGLSSEELFDRGDITVLARMINLERWPVDPRFHLVKCIAVASQSTVGTMEGLGLKPLPTVEPATPAPGGRPVPPPTAPPAGRQAAEEAERRLACMKAVEEGRQKPQAC